MYQNNKIKQVAKLNTPWQTLDPFLFSMHHLDTYPAGDQNMHPVGGTAGRNIGQDFSGKDGWSMYHGEKVPGFPYHPHRGFETVTITEQGLADHTDSLGNAGRFGEGDVQWMTAGNGVQHSEMFPLLKTDAPNVGELFQVWLNLPKKSKGVPANYVMLWHEDIPLIREKDANGKTTEVKVIAGDYKGQKALPPTPHSWANDPANEVAIWRFSLEDGAEIEIPAAHSDINRALYFYEGTELEVEGNALPEYIQIVVKSNESIKIKAKGGYAKVLLLQGKPIDEPVVQYGPFVMNTEEEIRETFAEYQRTQFGGWPWPTSEYVFPREKGRFARYADGSEEER